MDETKSQEWSQEETSALLSLWSTTENLKTAKLYRHSQIFLSEISKQLKKKYGFTRLTEDISNQMRTLLITYQDIKKAWRHGDTLASLYLNYFAIDKIMELMVENDDDEETNAATINDDGVQMSPGEATNDSEMLVLNLSFEYLFIEILFIVQKWTKMIAHRLQNQMSWSLFLLKVPQSLHIIYHQKILHSKFVL